ncbi:MAG: DUF4139 domain-containing protein [Deltaproteobacteria bacterium]|nr:DUF4139 domain-containing protein [Deltaproteobacteria bacterium]
MKTIRLLFLLVLFSMVLMAGAQDKPVPEGTAMRKSGLADQSSVALTIYNSNLALVKDQRDIEFGVGDNILQFADVAAQILPATVHIKSLTDAQGLHVLEQNYEYDLLNPAKLMEKYVGKEVKLFDKNSYTGKEDWLVGTLLSANDGYVYQIGNEIHINPPGRVILPQVPENLMAKPTLVWLLRATKAGKQKIETSYLTNKITWQADYITVLSVDDSKADLTGWVTIDNQSGATYQNAMLKLVAGDVHRVQPEQVYVRTMAMDAAPAAPPPPQFREESFFEYHLYTLDRPATVKENQTKQMTLLSAAAIPVTKRLVFQGQEGYFYNQYGEGSFAKQKVSVSLEIDNTQKNNLGMPLPKGTVRVYKADKDGSLQFIGEDAIDHTAKDEKLTVKMGEAFDVVGERKQTDFKRIADAISETAWEIALRNHKDQPATVRIIEPVPGDWEVLSASHKHEKADAHTLHFDVTVPTNKEVKVTYRVRVKM